MKLDKHIRQLERVLREQFEANDALLTLLKRKREAMSSAEHERMTQLCGLENEKVRLITDLERQRLMLVGEITQVIDPHAAQPLRLQEIAEHLPEPLRGRLLVLRAELRDKMSAVQAEAQVSRRVTESVYRHMQGMLQSIGAACTGVMTYGHTGRRPAASTAMSTFSATA